MVIQLFSFKYSMHSPHPTSLPPDASFHNNRSQHRKHHREINICQLRFLSLYNSIIMKIVFWCKLINWFPVKREGAAAIESLHDQKPLRLQVSWFTTRKTKENLRRELSYSKNSNYTNRNVLKIFKILKSYILIFKIFKIHQILKSLKGMVELAHLMYGWGGPCLHFWFKSSNFLGARLIRVRNSYKKNQIEL